MPNTNQFARSVRPTRQAVAFVRPPKHCQQFMLQYGVHNNTMLNTTQYALPYINMNSRQGITVRARHQLVQVRQQVLYNALRGLGGWHMLGQGYVRQLGIW